MFRKVLFLFAMLTLGLLMLHVGIASNDGQPGVDQSILGIRTTTDSAGNTVLEIHQRPIFFYDAAGNLQPIDDTLVDTGFGFSNETNTLKTTASREFGNGWQVSMDDSALTFEPVSLGAYKDGVLVAKFLASCNSQAEPGSKANTVQYRDSYPGLTDELVVRSGELEHVVTIPSRELLPEGDVGFVYRVTHSQDLSIVHHPMTITEDAEGGMISMPLTEIVKDGATTAIIPQPRVWDSAERTLTALGEIVWEPVSATEGYLTVKVRSGLLDRMEFPIMIDPAVQQVLSNVNFTGTSWGVLPYGSVTYAVRFNGDFHIGGVFAYFGPPLDYQTVLDVVSTPTFDVSMIPSKVKKAWFSSTILMDTYNGQECVEVNDHHSDTLLNLNAFRIFANNICDGRNSAPFTEILPPGLPLPDFTEDKTYDKADCDEDADRFSDMPSINLPGPAVHDLNKTLQGKLFETPSEYPLGPGYFAIALHDTSAFNMTNEIYLYSPRLTVEYNVHDEDPDVP